MKVIKNTIKSHRKLFGTKEACLEYLSKEKWGGGYVCKRCNCSEYYKGDLSFDRKCKQCRYNESPLSGTLFHSMKLCLVTAFEIVYRISVNKKGLSGLSIAREYGINQKSATLLRNKIQKAMASSEKYPLIGEIHVDEYMVGGPEKLKQGRSGDSKKKKATIAVEILPDNRGIGRLYSLQIKNFSTIEIKKIFDKHIDSKAFVVADMWTGYAPLAELYPNMVQKKSENGANFPELHLMIMNLKSWIKGIHHRISDDKFQDYLDEFTYRHNRRAFIETININLLARMARTKPHPAPRKRMKTLINVA